MNLLISVNLTQPPEVTGDVPQPEQPSFLDVTNLSVGELGGEAEKMAVAFQEGFWNVSAVAKGVVKGIADRFEIEIETSDSFMQTSASGKNVVKKTASYVRFANPAP